MQSEKQFDPLDLVSSASNASRNKEYWCDEIKSFPFGIVQIAPMRQISRLCAICRCDAKQYEASRCKDKTKQLTRCEWVYINRVKNRKSRIHYPRLPRVRSHFLPYLKSKYHKFKRNIVHLCDYDTLGRRTKRGKKTPANSCMQFFTDHFTYVRNLGRSR